MMENKTIQPLVGYGDIPFGITAADVLKLYGVPSQREELDAVNEEQSRCVFFEYENEGFSIYFEGIEALATSFSVFDEDAILFGEKIIGKDKKSLKDLLKREKYAFDDDNDDDCIVCDDLMADFYFENDELVEVLFRY